MRTKDQVLSLFEVVQEVVLVLLARLHMYLRASLLLFRGGFKDTPVGSVRT